MSARTPSRSHPIRRAMNQLSSLGPSWKRSSSLRSRSSLGSERAKSVPLRLGGSGASDRPSDEPGAPSSTTPMRFHPRHWQRRQRYGRLPVISFRQRSQRLRVGDRRRFFEWHLGQYGTSGVLDELDGIT